MLKVPKQCLVHSWVDQVFGTKKLCQALVPCGCFHATLLACEVESLLCRHAWKWGRTVSTASQSTAPKNAWAMTCLAPPLLPSRSASSATSSALVGSKQRRMLQYTVVAADGVSQRSHT